MPFARQEVLQTLEEKQEVIVKAFIYECNDFWRREYVRILKEAGHEPVVSAANIKEALSVVPLFKELGINAAIISCKHGNGFSDTDTERLTGAIKETYPSIPILAMKPLWESEFQGTADSQLAKTETYRLARRVKELIPNGQKLTSSADLTRVSEIIYTRGR